MSRSMIVVSGSFFQSNTRYSFTFDIVAPFVIESVKTLFGHNYWSDRRVLKTITTGEFVGKGKDEAGTFYIADFVYNWSRVSFQKWYCFDDPEGRMRNMWYCVLYNTHKVGKGYAGIWVIKHQRILNSTDLLLFQYQKTPFARGKCHIIISKFHRKI